MATKNATTETKTKRRRTRQPMTAEALHAQRRRWVEKWADQAADRTSPERRADHLRWGGGDPTHEASPIVGAWRTLRHAEDFCGRHLPDDADAVAALEWAREQVAANGINAATIHFWQAVDSIRWNRAGICDEFRAEDEGGERA